MPRNVNGDVSIASQPFNPISVTDAVAMNAALEDIRQMLESSLPGDGTRPPEADLPMGTHKHTGVGNAAARDQYATAGQVQDASLLWGGNAGGTANALTATLAPPITAYTNGMIVRVKATADNTNTVPTLNVNAVGAKTIARPGGAPLFPSDITSGVVAALMFDVQLDRFILLNPFESTGTFTIDFTTNFSSTLTVTFRYYRRNGWVTLVSESSQTGTSTGTTFVSATAVPASLRVSTGRWAQVLYATDNGTPVPICRAAIDAAGIMTLSRLSATADAGWTGSGAKGFGNQAIMSYPL